MNTACDHPTGALVAGNGFVMDDFVMKKRLDAVVSLPQ
jgi:hypothetical protein